VNGLDKLMEEISHEEKRLAFKEFNNKTALCIGQMFIEKAQLDSLPITIDINLNGHQLFHYSCDGTSPDNDQWIIRKNRVVNRFRRSSMYVHYILKAQNMTIEERFKISEKEFAASGGAFPITIEKVGVVGTITVSGLKQEEDHKLVVSVIEEYLKIESGYHF